MIDFDAIAREVNAQVAYYSGRRKRASVLEDDLRGLAWGIALEAAPKYDPELGPVGPYFGAIIRRQLGNYLITSGAPASGSIRHARDALCAARSVPALSERADGEDDASGCGAVLEDPAPWADEVLADAGWRERVTARLRRVVGEDGAEGLAHLLSEEKLSGGRSRRLMDSVRIARERIAGDGWLAAYYGATDHEKAIALRRTVAELAADAVARSGGRTALEDLAAAALLRGITPEDVRTAYRRGRHRSRAEKEASVLAALLPDVRDPEAHLRVCAVLRDVFPGDEYAERHDAAIYLARVGLDADVLRRVASGPGGWSDVAALVGDAGI